jgi:hypothetical protein
MLLFGIKLMQIDKPLPHLATSIITFSNKGNQRPVFYGP